MIDSSALDLMAPTTSSSQHRRGRRDAEEEVRSWGFGHVFTWSDPPCVIPPCRETPDSYSSSSPLLQCRTVGHACPCSVIVGFFNLSPSSTLRVSFTTPSPNRSYIILHPTSILNEAVDVISYLDILGRPHVSDWCPDLASLFSLADLDISPSSHLVHLPCPCSVSVSPCHHPHIASSPSPSPGPPPDSPFPDLPSHHPVVFPSSSTPTLAKRPFNHHLSPHLYASCQTFIASESMTDMLRLPHGH